MSTCLFCTAEIMFNLLLCKNPGWSRHVFLAKSPRFDLTDFVAVMNDDVSCSVPSVKNVIYGVKKCVTSWATILYGIMFTWENCWRSWIWLRARKKNPAIHITELFSSQSFLLHRSKCTFGPWKKLQVWMTLGRRWRQSDHLLFEGNKGRLPDTGYYDIFQLIVL